jgi:hypothetical protein
VDEKERELLADFHHTISEQLDSRLGESPRFFGLLIVVSTGYGYVLSKPELRGQNDIVVLAGLMSYLTVLWAHWYLAALGYAFRFLQNSQHCIEAVLGWNPEFVPGPEKNKRTGTPPPPGPISSFWLLPEIYHAHLAALIAFLLLICSAIALSLWKSLGHFQVLLVASGLAIVGVGSVYWMNTYYLVKYTRKRRDPGEARARIVAINP